MPDVLDQQHRQITERLKELAPVVEEHHRLQAAAKALARIRRSSSAIVPTRRHKPRRASGGAKAITGTPTKKPGRPKKVGRPAAGNAAGVASATTTTKRRAGRRKGSGTRAAQALALVKEQPGITIPELATKMGIQQNYLYRVLPALQKERKVTKQGKGWHARGSKPSPRS